MQKTNFQIIKGWIASYRTAVDLEDNKERLTDLIFKYAKGNDKQRLQRFIELKEMQLSGKPVFDVQGYLLDNHFNPATYTYYNALAEASKIREQGYYVKLDGKGHIKIQLLETELVNA